MIIFGLRMSFVACFGLSVSVKSASVVILQGWNCSSQGGILWQMKQTGQLHFESSMIRLKLLSFRYAVQHTLLMCCCIDSV